VLVAGNVSPFFLLFLPTLPCYVKIHPCLKKEKKEKETKAILLGKKEIKCLFSDEMKISKNLPMYKISKN
jgi:hypothetical protein